MTVSSSPKDLIAAYRINARQSAAAANMPSDRSAFPGLGLNPSGMIYLRGGKHLAFRATGTRESFPLLPEMIEDALTGEEKRTVVADLETYARMTVMAENMPASDFNSLARRMRISRSLPVSQKLPILTEALTARYWLQDGLDEASLEDWCTGFDLEDLPITAQLDALIELAVDGERSESFRYCKTMEAMELLERKIMENCTYSGMSTDCYVYSMLEQYGVKANSLRLLDPLLLPLHALDGQVCRIVPMEMRADGFTSSVSTPFKFKEGAKCNLTDGTKVAPVTMMSLRYGAGVLHAEFSNPSTRSKGEAMVARARSGQAPLYAVEIPFESFGKPLSNRWLGEPVEATSGRQLPLDVILAGAPVE